MSTKADTKLDHVLEATNTAYQALKDLKDAEKQQALRFISDRLGVAASGPPPTPPPAAGVGGGAKNGVQRNGSTPTPKAFILAKKPQTMIEKAVCLAYYLTHHRGALQFKTKDLSTLNGEAGQAAFTSASVHVNNAAKNKYLTAAGRGAKRITTLGEALVDALPDRKAVATALASHGPITGRRKRKGRKAKAGK